MGSYIVDGKFQSDKYPTCPAGKVPLSVEDVTAQDLLWEYAQRRREVDADFSSDLESSLLAAGYRPTQAQLVARRRILCPSAGCDGVAKPPMIDRVTVERDQAMAELVDPTALPSGSAASLGTAGLVDPAALPSGSAASLGRAELAQLRSLVRAPQTDRADRTDRIDQSDPIASLGAMITMAELERRYVRQVLEAVQGNKTHAARILGIHRRSLYRRIEGRTEGSSSK